MKTEANGQLSPSVHSPLWLLSPIHLPSAGHPSSPPQCLTLSVCVSDKTAKMKFHCPPPSTTLTLPPHLPGFTDSAVSQSQEAFPGFAALSCFPTAQRFQQCCLLRVPRALSCVPHHPCGVTSVPAPPADPVSPPLHSRLHFPKAGMTSPRNALLETLTACSLVSHPPQAS